MTTLTSPRHGIGDQLLGQLAQSTWDPALFMKMLPALAPAVRVAGAWEQQQWIRALDLVWQHAAPDRAGGNLAFELGVLAGDMHYWERAAFFFLAATERGRRDGLAWHNLGAAQWQLAQHEQAETSFLAAVRSHPAAAVFQRQLSALRGWRDTCAAVLGADRLEDEGGGAGMDGRLAATPLGPHHALPLLRLHSDAIADGAKMPRLRSREDALGWIRASTAAPCMALAVVHPLHGLIGVVALERHRDDALFGYWIGVPFQRKGHGSQAIGLLTAFARRQGIRALFSAVYDDNPASQAVLRRRGFRALRVAVEPAEALHYHAWHHGSGGEPASLQALLASAGSSRRLVLPAADEVGVC
jgi:RimJ/RimL family protein N-acetyltransferase